MASAVDPRIPIHRLDLERYEQMVEHRILGEEDRVELLDGVLSEMNPQGERHSDLIEWLTDELASHARGGGYRVRVQLPMRLQPSSMPEPDLTLRPRGARGHPSHVPLAIEVSVTSQATDLGVKAGLYAAAGIDELWVIDIPARVVHVHRSPTPDGYADVTQLNDGELRSTAVAAAPPIDVAALLALTD